LPAIYAKLIAETMKAICIIVRAIYVSNFT